LVAVREDGRLRVSRSGFDTTHGKFRDLAHRLNLREPGRSNPAQFIQGVHKAFVVLGGMTLVSTVVFGGLKRGDSDAESQGKELHAG
jgi:hypothetical protein